MRCWNCLTETEIEGTPVGFGATCPHCFAYLHACMGCKFYSATSSTACDHPQAEYVGEKSHRNVCEYFSVLPKLLEPNQTDRDEIETQATVTRKRKTETLQRFDELFG